MWTDSIVVINYITFDCKFTSHVHAMWMLAINVIILWCVDMCWNCLISFLITLLNNRGQLSAYLASCCLQLATFGSLSLHGPDLPDGVLVVVVVMNVIISLVHGDVQWGYITSLFLIRVNVGIALIRMPTNAIMMVYKIVFLNDVKIAINICNGV